MAVGETGGAGMRRRRWRFDGGWEDGWGCWRVSGRASGGLSGKREDGQNVEMEGEVEMVEMAARRSGGGGGLRTAASR